MVVLNFNGFLCPCLSRHFQETAGGPIVHIVTFNYISANEYYTERSVYPVLFFCPAISKLFLPFHLSVLLAPRDPYSRKAKNVERLRVSLSSFTPSLSLSL